MPCPASNALLTSYTAAGVCVCLQMLGLPQARVVCGSSFTLAVSTEGINALSHHTTVVEKVNGVSDGVTPYSPTGVG